MKNNNFLILFACIILIILGIFGYYKVSSCKVIFVVEQEIYKSINARRNTSITTFDKPEREGYIFIGWYDENDNLFSFDDKILENQVYYARWGIIDTGEDPKKGND